MAADRDSDVEVRKTLRVGLIDTFSPAFYIDTYAPTIEHLKKTLPQYKFESVEYPNLSAFKADQTHPVDFLLSTSGTYAVLRDSLGIEHLVTRKSDLVQKPSMSVGSVFVVRSDRNDIHRIADLKNKNVAAASPESFDGWFTALDAIELEGLDSTKFFRKTIFTDYGYPDVISQVLLKNADVGILTLCQLERAIERKDVGRNDLKVIGARTAPHERCRRSTDLYPAEVFSTMPQTETEVAKDVAVALLTMPKLKRSWQWVTLSDLVNVSGLLKRLQLGPYAYQRQWTIEAVVVRYKTEIILFLALIAAITFHIVTINILVRRRTRQLIAALNEKEELLEKAKRTQEYLNLLERTNIVSQLSALFAHELKQPVTNIINYAAGLSLLRKSDDQLAHNPMVDKALDAINAQARRVAEIVERVRAYAKHQPRLRSMCRLNDIIEQMIANFRLAKTSGTVVEVDVAPDIMVRADPVELELLFLNLLKNADRAVKNVDSPKVTIRSVVEGSRVKVTVSDNGPQIDESVLAGLGKIGGVRNPQGLGMGLAIATGIAEQHNGHLEFARSPLGGLMVTVVLDCEIAQAAIDGDKHG